MTQRIRAATPDDATAIARVHTDSWRVAYRGIMPDSVLEELSEEESAVRWRARLSQPTHGTLVVEADGRVVGFASVGPSRDDDATPRTGELLALYLAPGAWGCGLGRALWDEARSALAAVGFTEATVWVLEANARARAFYKRVGFLLEPATTKISERGGTSLVQVRYRIGLS